MMAPSARFRRPGFPVVLGGCAVLLTLGIALALLAQPVALRVLGVAAIVGAWLLPVLYAVHFRARARFRKTATGEDVRTSQKALVSAVDKARQRFSTEQSRQDRALTRIEEHLRGLTAASESRSFQVGEPGIDVLFVTSNGAGLGHISRSMAIARQLAEGRSFEILTLSSAYRQVAGQGVTTHYFPSSGASGEMSRVWNRHFRAHLLHLMEEKRPRVVVFDGTWVYAALTEICKLRGTPLIWIQRGMWQDKVDKASTQRHAAAKVADHVIVPGDFAGDELVDPGPGIVPRHVGPIVMTTKDDVIGRDAACAALELDPSRRYVLLNLGGGGISDPGTLALSFRQLLKDRAPDLVLVQVVSPLTAAKGLVEGVVQVHAYPVMPYVRAFEFMICAAGYNSAQESVSLEIPAILVPNTETRTDDQLRRAELLASKGLCLTAVDFAGMQEAVEQMLDPEWRAAIRRRLESLESPRGAREAADHLDELITQAGWPSRAAKLEGASTDGQ